MEKVKAGIVGCGNISSIYFETIGKLPLLEIVACADMDPERAKAQGARYEIPHVYTVDELLADPQIEMVVNLTIPAVHADIHRRALDAGKNTYGEKPLAVRLEDGASLLALANGKGLLIGAAPDTFLGGGIQTCRKLIDDGRIGKPIAATAFMMSHGPERFHPNPGFLYAEGAGPMFDMGPYYITALINLIGPIRRVSGMASAAFAERKIANGPSRGRVFPVQTPTHVAGLLEFHSGAVGTIVTSFDVWGTNMPNHIEVHGTDGSLLVPDPNTFGGPVYVKRHDQQQFAEVPLTHGNTVNSRGIGALDMAHALRSGSRHRADGELAYHVLETMHGFFISASKGAHYDIASTCAKPEPLAPDDDER